MTDDSMGPDHATTSYPSTPTAGDLGGVATLVSVQTWRSEEANMQRLAKMLPEFRIVSLPPPDAEPFPRRVEAWVDLHHRQLVTTNVSGPLYLMGWSFGGVVAAELARRLRNEGREVRFLAMVDTIRPSLKPLSSKEYIWLHLREAASIPNEADRVPYLVRKFSFLLHRRFPRLGRIALTTAQRLGWGRDIVAIDRECKPLDPLTASIRVSYLNYRGDGIDFPVCLYATEPSAARAARPVLSWSDYLHGGYRITPIAGDHYSLYAPEHIDSLATALRRDIEITELSGRQLSANTPERF